MRPAMPVIAVFVLTLCSSNAFAFDWRDPVAAGNREGNELVAQEKYEEAREVYRGTLDREPKSPELRYNIGLSLAHEARHEEAIEDFEAVITSDKKLDSARHYNVGLCQYRDAVAAKEGQDIQKAVELIEAAVESNKDALRRNPTDMDAKHNLELALKIRDEFKQEQQQQEQQDESQQDQQQDEENSEQEQQDREQQENSHQQHNHQQQQ